jgi:alkyl hydroperoxide reductase subunit F
MLDDGLKTQLKAYLQNLRQPIELVASLGEGQGSKDMLALLEDVAGTSDKVSLNLAGDDARKPSFAITRAATRRRRPLRRPAPGPRVHLAGAGPAARRRPPAEVRRRGAGPGPRPGGRVPLRDLFLAELPELPGRGPGAEHHGALNPNITHVAIDGALFQAEVEERQVMAVPTILLNGQPFGQGRMSLEQILAKLDTGAADRAAEKIKTKDAFDVLVSAAAPPARRRRSTPPARASHRRGGRALRRPGAGHHGHRELHLGVAHRGPQAGLGPGAARQGL